MVSQVEDALKHKIKVAEDKKEDQAEKIKHAEAEEIEN